MQVEVNNKCVDSQAVHVDASVQALQPAGQLVQVPASLYYPTGQVHSDFPSTVNGVPSAQVLHS